MFEYNTVSLVPIATQLSQLAWSQRVPRLWTLRTPRLSSPFTKLAKQAMSTPSGLQRRRVAATSSYDPDDEQNPTSAHRPALSTASTSNSYSDINGIRSTHAGTALEGGSKIAYDPRDLVGSGSADEQAVPKLTLLEEILLLGIKDRAVSDVNIFQAPSRHIYGSANLRRMPPVGYC